MMVKKDKKILIRKCYTNTMILERISKLSREEKQEIVLEGLKSHSERDLGEMWGYHHSTIHDWKTLRQSNIGKDIHVSLSTIYRKLRGLLPEEIEDWGRIEQIKETCEELLKQK